MVLKFLLFFLSFFSITAKQPIYLNSVYHHEGSDSDKGIHIELGAIITIFSESTMPTVLSKSQEDGRVITSLLFPNVSYKDSNGNPLQREIIGNEYTFLVKEVTKPHKGLACSISYHASTVSFLYESIKNSSGKSGYLFRFLNKKALKELDEKSKDSPLITLASNQTPRVVIDPGHGGTDFGACGHEIIEKDLALLVSKRIVKQLRSDGYDALLTRPNDQDLGLSRRTAIANQVGADVFVSIHANAAPNRNASGIETFFYDNSPQESRLHISDLKNLAPAYQKYMLGKTQDSQLLAYSVQKAACESAKSAMGLDHNIDRSVKKGPFQVIMGSIAPAILVEIGFISNEKEAAMLKTASYQRKIAQGICAGIRFYFKTKIAQRLIA